jgi:hypothetical protein
MLHLCTLFFQYDIHKNAFKIQYYYPALIEHQNAPLTYYLCSSVCLLTAVAVLTSYRIMCVEPTN